jgi:hypothetical protein
MTILANDPTTRTESAVDVRVGRIQAWLLARRRDALVFVPLVVLDVVVRLINFGGAPQRVGDEGTVVAQAFALLSPGRSTAFPRWADLGSAQIAGYAALTGAFHRHPSAVLAGREAMLVAAGVSALLLGVLARRLGRSRTAAGIAVALMALSPVAVQFQRTVHLENVAVPWALGALALALSPGRRPAAAAGAGLCFAVAVLSRPTCLLLAPVLVWLLVRGADPADRRYVLALSATAFVLLCSVFVALAHGVDLGGLGFLVSRPAAGSVFDPASAVNHTVAVWLDLDLVLPLVSVPAAVVGLFLPALRPLRPIAAGHLLLVLVVLRPGALPLSYLIPLIPLAALLVAAVGEVAGRQVWRWVRSGRLPLLRRRPWAPPLLLVVLLGLVIGLPAWRTPLRWLELAGPDAPVAQAESWIETQVPGQDRIIVDDSLWVDLVRSGRGPADVVRSAAVDAGWRTYDWVVSTDSVRALLGSAGQLDLVEQHSTVVAAFGSGVDRVEIRHVDTAATPAPGAAAQLAQRVQAGQALAANPHLRLSPTARALLVSGRVDLRLLGTLATLAPTTTLVVEDFPAIAAEDAARQPRRQVELSSPDPTAVTAAQRFYTSQYPPFRPAHVDRAGDSLRVTYFPAAPLDLLAALTPHG